jgi:hypothetical protein
MIFKKIADFLFGKDPDIFDEKGNVRHKFPQQKWDAWNKRYQEGKEFNWRHHSGMRAKDLKNNPNQR